MTQETFYLILVLGFVVIIACAIYATYYFVKVLKSITSLTDSVSDKLQMKALALIQAVLVAIFSKIIKKRG